MAKSIENVKTTSFLAKSTDLSGKLMVKHGIRIDGRISGSIESESVIYLGESAEVSADITTETLLSSGQVEGDIKASNHVQINLPGSLKGSVETRELIVEKGVFIEGACKIIEQEKG